MFAKSISVRNWGVAAFAMLASLLLAIGAAQAEPLVMTFLDKANVGEIVPGATEYGQLRSDIPVVEALKDGKVVGYVFLTSDFVTTTGYSGKPIHTLMGVDGNAKVTGVRLVKHSEPIVLVGIPESKITAVTEKYAGLDLIAEAAAGGSAHDLDIVSGATVTIIVIDDSIVRAGLKVARSLGLGGLEPELASSGPTKALSMPSGDDVPISDWQTLAGDGSIRSLRLDIGQVNTAFEETGDARAIKRPEKGAPEDTFIDMQMALVSAPEIGRTLLGDDEYANLLEWLDEGDQAILVVGRGKYSFKGSGYVRGGIFDRIQLIQGDTAVRFHDKQHKRIGKLVAEDAPSFTELDIFKVKAGSGFDPAEPFRLQLLVQRAVGAIDKAFITFDLGYRIPDRHTEKLAAETAEVANPQIQSDVAVSDTSELSHLWKRVWLQKRVEVVVLVVALVILTGVFFFQMQVMSIYTSNWDSDNFWKNVTLQLRLLRPESQLRCNVSLAMRMLPLFPKRASRIRCFHR
ncbi:FMN-binding protein [Devosia sp.]|uniref:FMN-binding protein n=1 Tax=Devosia sp. TaxID=1871048 RepID=UPI00273641FE|nr:FMN-binding protein [Devosia sp.]MDP2781055.1 FMN-binding protein [Devosia sp.]